MRTNWLHRVIHNRCHARWCLRRSERPYSICAKHLSTPWGKLLKASSDILREWLMVEMRRHVVAMLVHGRDDHSVLNRMD